MGGRYYVTGVQLGMIQVFIEHNKLEELEKLMYEIDEKQFIGQCEVLRMVSQVDLGCE